MSDTTCYGKDCDRPIHSKGLCGPHYNMMRTKGHVDLPLGFRRPRGELTRLLREASTAITGECIKVTMPSRDRVVVTYNGRQMYAARAVWSMAHGDPGTSFVLHNCGNGHAGCVNINHLYLGDHGQNMKDKVEDGTSSRGARNVHAKLDEAQVQQIRLRLATGEPRRAIANEYRVAVATIAAIASGQTWSWLPGPTLDLAASLDVADTDEEGELTMGCNCNKNRARTDASGNVVPAGTYRVMVGTRKVYESTNPTAAETVAKSFSNAKILAPGEAA